MAFRLYEVFEALIPALLLGLALLYAVWAWRHVLLRLRRVLPHRHIRLPPLPQAFVTNVRYSRNNIRDRLGRITICLVYP